MSRLPPLLPAETLARVLRLARFDGTGALVLGGVFALVAAAGREVPFAIIGLLAAGAGAIELHGVTLLRQGSARGMNWLIASQPFLLTVVLGYCAVRLWFMQIPAPPEGFQALFAASAAQWGMTVDEYLRTLNRLTAGAVALAALGFQGGMTVYYLRRRRPVNEALGFDGTHDQSG
jgi:hypothetical protein